MYRRGCESFDSSMFIGNCFKRSVPPKQSLALKSNEAQAVQSTLVCRFDLLGLQLNIELRKAWNEKSTTASDQSVINDASDLATLPITTRSC